MRLSRYKKLTFRCSADGCKSAIVVNTNDVTAASIHIGEAGWKIMNFERTYKNSGAKHHDTSLVCPGCAPALIAKIEAAQAA